MCDSCTEREKELLEALREGRYSPFALPDYLPALARKLRCLEQEVDALTARLTTLEPVPMKRQEETWKVETLPSPTSA